MAKRLIGTNSVVLMRLPLPIDRHTRAIYELLANGVNVRLTLTKEDGSTYTYELEEYDV